MNEMSVFFHHCDAEAAPDIPALALDFDVELQKVQTSLGVRPGVALWPEKQVLAQFWGYTFGAGPLERPNAARRDKILALAQYAGRLKLSGGRGQDRGGGLLAGWKTGLGLICMQAVLNCK